jgi:hypothetical protein
MWEKFPKNPAALSPLVGVPCVALTVIISRQDVEMSFREDLLLGEKYQRLFLDLIVWEKSEMATGNFSPWDCRVWNGDEEVSFEVKADRKARFSNNIVIEFECSGRPSGINVTQSDYWVYFIVGTGIYYMIPIDELRAAINNQKYTRKVRGGDGYRSQMYLFPAEVFSDFREHIPGDKIPHE